MVKLYVKEQKILRLENVLIKELQDISIELLDNEIIKFMNFIETSKIQTRGPLVTCNSGTRVNSIGEVSTDYLIMVQTVRKCNLDGYKFKKLLKVENCLYVRYQGIAEDFSYAQSKLDLHIWENNLIEKGYMYTVHINAEGNHLCADIFRPVEKFNENL